MKILALIPAHNESKSIASVVRSVRGLQLDALVIDDGSEDRTAELARAAGAEVVSTGIKSGKGKALRVGFEHALKGGYGAVITLDGDGQHASSDIPLFISCYELKKAAIVNGNRMANPKGMPPVRLATNAFMSWLISLVCGQNIPDTQCGFRLISTDVLRAITLECSSFEIETEILIKASKKGFKTASVPVATIYRDEKSKIQPFKDTLRFIRYIIKESFKK